MFFNIIKRNFRRNYYLLKFAPCQVSWQFTPKTPAKISVKKFVQIFSSHSKTLTVKKTEEKIWKTDEKENINAWWFPTSDTFVYKSNSNNQLLKWFVILSRMLFFSAHFSGSLFSIFLLAATDKKNGISSNFLKTRLLMLSKKVVKIFWKIATLFSSTLLISLFFSYPPLHLL